MAHLYGFGGPVNNTNYRTYHANNFLYTDGYGMPTGNLDSTGNRPIRVYSVGVDWHTGATYAQLNYQGSGNVGSGVWGSSGGTFRMVVGHGTGTLGVGRNTNNGLQMTDSADGDTVQGGIVGSLSWGTAPAAPAMVSAVSGAGGQVKVVFSGSGDTGGVPITGWVLAYADNAAFNSPTIVGSNGTSILQLTPGKTYWFKAAGRNDVVDALSRFGAWSAPISAFVYGTPSAPQSLAASQSSINSASLSWAAPADNGGTAVVSYDVQAATSPDFSDAWLAWQGANPATTVNGLTGTVYFRVAAQNAQGYGPWAPTVTLALATAPGTPAGPTVNQSGPGAVDFTWTAPGSGGSPITGYAVQWSTSSNFSSAVTTIENGTWPGVSLSGLPGQTVYFRVLAHNRFGDSGWSTVVSKLLATAPTAPRDLAATQTSSTTVNTSWVAPASNGGSPITGYRIEYGLNGSFDGAQAVNVGDRLSFELSGLTPGLSYYVRAAALNGATTAGAALVWSSGVAVKLTVEIGNLDEWSSFGTLPPNTTPIVAGALRRGSVVTVLGKSGLIREIQATGPGSVVGGSIGIQRTITGLKVGATYRLTGTVAVTAPVTPNPNTYAFGVVGKTTGTPTTVVLGTPSPMPEYTFKATATSHIIRVIMTETSSYTAGWLEGVAFYDIKFSEMPLASPYRLQDTVYEGPLSTHLSYACDSVGASWWVDRMNVTQFRQATSQDGVVATFSDRRAPGVLEYVEPAASYDTRNVVNVLEVANHGRNPATGDADDLSSAGADPASVAEWGARGGKIDTTLRNNFVSRTNLVTNPVAAENTTAYTSAGDAPGTPALTRVTGQNSPNASTAMRLQPGGATTEWMEVYFGLVPVTAGRIYTFSADVLTNAGAIIKAGFVWRNAAGAAISVNWGDDIATPGNEWKRRSMTATAPVGAINAVLVVKREGPGAAGTYLQTTALLCEEGALLGEYFDGSTAPDYRVTELRRNLATIAAPIQLGNSTVRSNVTWGGTLWLGEVTPGASGHGARNDLNSLVSHIPNGATIYASWEVANPNSIPVPVSLDVSDGGTVTVTLAAGERRRIETSHTLADYGTTYRFSDLTSSVVGKPILYRQIMTDIAPLGAYFDGSTPDTAQRDYRWAYTVNGSVSVEALKGTSGLPTQLFEWTSNPHGSTAVRRTQHVTLLINDSLDEHSTPAQLVTRVRWNAQQNPELAAALEIQDRVRVEFNGTSQDSRIIGIKHDLSPTRWMVDLALDPS